MASSCAAPERVPGGADADGGGEGGGGGAAAPARVPGDAGGGGGAAAPERVPGGADADGGGEGGGGGAAAPARVPGDAGGGGGAAAPARVPGDAGGGGGAAAPARVPGGAGATLTAAQRARIERQRQRARALHDARLVQQHHSVSEAAPRGADTGGGFLPEEPPLHEPRAPRHAPAPLVHRSEQPHCLECERPFPMSYLFDTFDYSVCDECRDDAEAHALLTRTEAKTEYLLKDCDLDKREPPLRCVRRRNPHKAHYSDMRLYLRPQVEARALQVWGSPAALEEERGARARRRERAQHTSTARRLRELRMAARSSLFEGRRAGAAHAHEWGAERHDAAADSYSRVCRTCGHTETYEKM